MEAIINFFKSVVANWEIITGLVLGLIVVAEHVVRLTATEKDDGAVQRIGGIIKKIFDALKVPNRLKKPEDKK